MRKNKFFKNFIASLKEAITMNINRKDPPPKTTYRTLNDGSVLRTITYYSSDGQVVRTETDHLPK